MKKNKLVVPIDFTPVSHEALLYACELAVNNDLEIVAVHVLDTKVIEEFSQHEDAELRETAKQMQQDMEKKTRADLDNFLDGLSVFYGDIIEPLVAHGTIYDAFNTVARENNGSLVIMGTHGIVGMQHVFGSKAYKVVAGSGYPFLVVQARSYNTINKVYLVLKNKAMLEAYADDLLNFAKFFKGEFLVCYLDNSSDGLLPVALNDLAHRFSFGTANFQAQDIVLSASKAGADVIGFGIDESENDDNTVYGLSQDRILVNNLKLPVLCLPDLSKKKTV